MTHIVFLIALFFAFPDLNKKFPFYIFTFSTLFLFLALRYDYGNDYMSYFNIHAAINAGLPSWGQDDILFKYLNLLIPNFYWFIVIISLFYILTIYYLIKSNLKIKEYWFAGLLLLINPYLFLVHLSSLRQTLAICFVIFSINFVIKKKPFMYYLFIIIAMGFHKSAMVLLPVYFILNDSKIKKKWSVLIYGLLAVLIGTPLFETILYRVLEYFPRYYTYYFKQGLQNSLRATLISSLFFFFVIFNINKLEGKEIIYGKLSLIATIISLLAIRASMITRIGMYFDIFLILTIPQIFSRIRGKANRQILFIIMISIYLLRYVSFFNNPIWIEAYSVYRTILSK